MRGRLINPENLGLKFWKLGVVLDSPRTIWVDFVKIYVINYGLGVVGPEVVMDFGSTKWNRCLVRGLPTDSPLHGCGTVKNTPGLLVGLKLVHVCCKQNIA